MGARPEETFDKKPNFETPRRPWILGVGTSCFPSQDHRNPRSPGHPGGKRGASWHGPPLYTEEWPW
eukprot:2298074-Pyramimonas_sp.AAC.1